MRLFHKNIKMLLLPGLGNLYINWWKKEDMQINTEADLALLAV